MINGVLTLIAALLIFGGVILIHELGHFAAALLFKIRILEFSVGMGPAVITKKFHEIKFSLRALPIGGYVSMDGEFSDDADETDDEPRQDAQSSPEEDIHSEKSGVMFNKAPALHKIVVLSAGAFMNFVLGFLALLVLLANQSYYGSCKIAQFEDNALSGQTGLQVDDEIFYVNEHKCYVYSDIIYELERTENYQADFVVKRDGKTINIPGVQFDKTVSADGTESLSYGFKLYGIKKTPITCVQQSLRYTEYYAHLIISSIVDMAKGHVSINDLSGPVGIVSEIHTAVSYGWRDVVNIMALITINLGIMNLLPFPALDGGRIVLAAVEGIIRRPLPEKFEAYLNLFGMAVLMLLMIFITCHDLINL